MKIILAILLTINLLFIFLFKSLVAEENIIPLSKITLEKKINTAKNKLEYISYFSTRCGSLLKAINKYEPNKKMFKIASDLHKSALFTKNIINKRSADYIDSELKNDILLYTNIYNEKMYINNENNKHYIKGSDFLILELKICKKFIPKAYSFLQKGF